MNRHNWFEEGRDVQDDHPRRWQLKMLMDGCKCGQSTDLGALRSKIRCDTKSRRIGYVNLFRGKDPNSGLTILGLPKILK
jgi:hypothetical protein